MVPAQHGFAAEIKAMRKLLMFNLFILLSRPVFGQVPDCHQSVRFLSTFRWANVSERRFVRKGAVIRGNIGLSQGARLLIYETGTTTITFPYSGEPKARFKIVSGEKELLSVSMAQMPELRGFSDGMRPTFIARLCPNSGGDLVVVGSGSGATGEAQFFLVFAGSHGEYRYFALPLSDEGKLELSTKEPGTVMLWSALASEQINGAKRYDISTYKLDETGFHFVSRHKTRRKYGPFLDHNIVFQRCR